GVATTLRSASGGRAVRRGGRAEERVTAGRRVRRPVDYVDGVCHRAGHACVEVARVFARGDARTRRSCRAWRAFSSASAARTAGAAKSATPKAASGGGAWESTAAIGG